MLHTAKIIQLISFIHINYKDIPCLFYSRSWLVGMSFGLNITTISKLTCYGAQFKHGAIL